ncbi:MAG: PAC2 family protein [Actinobacteria bacterium]|nr:PAC2 family protein [Actinomycetota bacterium]
MSSLVERVLRPELTDPVLLVAMEGWIDSGMGVANAAAALMNGSSPQVVATFDTDRLLDHRARRPVMHIVNGLITGLTWPTIQLLAGTDSHGRDILLLVGAEPDFEWRGFTDAVVGLVTDLDCRMVVSLGAYP